MYLSSIICYFSLNTGNFEKQINKGDEPWLIDFCVTGGGEKLKLTVYSTMNSLRLVFTSV